MAHFKITLDSGVPAMDIGRLDRHGVIRIEPNQGLRLERIPGTDIFLVGPDDIRAVKQIGDAKIAAHVADPHAQFFRSELGILPELGFELIVLMNGDDGPRLGVRSAVIIEMIR